MKIDVFVDLSMFNEFKVVTPISVDFEKTPHVLLTGGTGSGKTYALMQLLGKIVKNTEDKNLLIGDFKRGIDLRYLASYLGKGYFDYSNYIDLVDYIHGLLNERKEMPDDELINLKPVFVVLEEWGAFITSLDKKEAEIYKKKLGEILMLSREYKIHLIVVLQRADSSFFGNGARDNFSVRIGLGKLSSESKRMLFSDDDKAILDDLRAEQGRGGMFVEGNDLKLVKVPSVAPDTVLRIRDNIEVVVKDTAINLYKNDEP